MAAQCLMQTPWGYQVPPILENSEHRYSRYTFQLAAYGCKSAAMVRCNPCRRAWRARALQMVFRSRGTQAVVMRWLGSRSWHISVQWCKNKSEGLERPEMQSITWLLSPMNRMSMAGRVLRSSATMGGPRALTRVASAAQMGMAACREGPFAFPLYAGSSM